MNFRRELISFNKEEVSMVTDLIFNKGIKSNEEVIKILNDKFVDEETTQEIINALKVNGYIEYEQMLKLNDEVSIKPSYVSLDSLIQDGLYKLNNK